MNLSPRTTPLQLILLTQWLLRASGGEDSTIIPLFWYSILQTTEIQVFSCVSFKRTLRSGAVRVEMCIFFFLGHQSAQYMKSSFYGDINLHGIIWRLFLFVCLFFQWQIFRLILYHVSVSMWPLCAYYSWKRNVFLNLIWMQDTCTYHKDTSNIQGCFLGLCLVLVFNPQECGWQRRLIPRAK